MKKEDIVEARRLYEEEHLSLRKLGELYNLTHEAIRKNLINDGCKLRGVGFKTEDQVDVNIEQLLLYYYRDRLTVASIGRRMNTTADTIKKRLKRLGIVPERRGYIQSTLDEKEVINLWNKGWGSYRIAKKIGGVSSQTVWRFLKSRVQMRSPGAPIRNRNATRNSI